MPSLSGYSIKFRGEVRKFIRNFQNLAQATSSDGLNYKLFQSRQRIKPNFKEACLRRNTIPNFSTSKATSYFRDEVKVKSVNANEEYLTDTSTNTFLKQCSSKILSSRKEWETKISAFKSPSLKQRGTFFVLKSIDFSSDCHKSNDSCFYNARYRGAAHFLRLESTQIAVIFSSSLDLSTMNNELPRSLSSILER